MNEVVKEAIDRGYYTTIDGTLFNVLNQEIKGSVNNKGYTKFSFRNEKYQAYPMMVHRIQAFQKYGDRIFEEGIVVRHLDGNKLNNSSFNISIGTQLDNIMDKTPEQRSLDASHPIHNHDKIIEDRKLGLTYKELMLKYDISSKGTISFIINKSIKNRK